MPSLVLAPMSCQLLGKRLSGNVRLFPGFSAPCFMGRPELRGCAHNARRQLATLREKILEWFVFVAPFSASRFYRFGLCGICGQPSDTSEHRIKKSDLVQQYGTGPYRGTETLMHFKAGRVSKVQGPDSALVKYRKDLCGQCNSSFTKPFDLIWNDLSNR